MIGFWRTRALVRDSNELFERRDDRRVPFLGNVFQGSGSVHGEARIDSFHTTIQEKKLKS